MRQALVNENADMCAIDSRYVMRITANDEAGVKQLDNFRNVEKEYPVLVTTSKLLSTGVDVQTVKFIVLDSNIRSMTEFKQIIGRGTRVREDLGKMYFTIFDFRDVTRLLHDPDFDGPIEQEDDFHPNKPGEGPERPPKITPPERERRQKYVLGSTQVSVSQKHVQYLDKDGHLITERLIDYTKRNVLNQYAEMNDFLAAWNAADRKQAIIDELEKRGVFFDDAAKPPFYGKNAKAADINGFISATGEFIKNYVTAMRSGDFKPQAVDGCDYCPACDICRRYGIKAAGGADEDV